MERSISHSTAAKDEVLELLNEVDERIHKSRSFGYQILSRLFDERQLGLVAQLNWSIDSCIENSALQESVQKRGIFQRIAKYKGIILSLFIYCIRNNSKLTFSS